MEYNRIVFRNIRLSAQQIFRKSGNFVGNKQMGKGPYGLFLRSFTIHRCYQFKRQK